MSCMHSKSDKSVLKSSTDTKNINLILSPLKQPTSSAAFKVSFWSEMVSPKRKLDIDLLGVAVNG